MSHVTRWLTIAVAVSMALPPSVMAGEHVVQRAEMAARLRAAEAERSGNQLRIRRFVFRHAPATAGVVDVRKLDVGLAAMSDAELRDLARRADALEVDPVAGWSTKTWIIIGAAVLVVVILAAAAVESCKEQGSECV